MIYDPFIVILKQFGQAWWSFWIIYALFDITINLLLLYSFGGIWWDDRIREFFQDRLSIIWPFMILGPVAGTYVLTYDLGIRIQEQFEIIGMRFVWPPYITNLPRTVFVVIICASAVVAIATRFRYEKYRPDIWFNNPKLFGRIRTVLFDFPMSIMVLLTSFRLIEQWMLIHAFLSSDWLPPSPYHPDNMYGLRWLYTIVIIQAVIVILLSFTPSLMMFRVNVPKYAWIYQVLLICGLLSLAVAITILVFDFHIRLGNIYTYQVEMLVDSVDMKVILSPSSQDMLLRQSVISQHLSMILSLPSGFPIPVWFSSLLSLRLVLVLANTYGFLAQRYSLPAIHIALLNLLDENTGRKNN